MDRREQEKVFRDMLGKAPAWKKEVLLMELFYRAQKEDKEFALGYLEGRRKIFENL